MNRLRNPLPSYDQIIKDIFASGPNGDTDDFSEVDEKSVIESTGLPSASFDRLYGHLSERPKGLLINHYHLLHQEEGNDLQTWGIGGEESTGIFIANGMLIIRFPFDDGNSGGIWNMIYISKSIHSELIEVARNKFVGNL